MYGLDVVDAEYRVEEQEIQPHLKGIKGVKVSTAKFYPVWDSWKINYMRMLLKESFLGKNRTTASYLCAEIEALVGAEPLRALTSFLPQDHYFELVKIEEAVENELKLLEGIDIHQFREFSRYQKFVEVQSEIQNYKENLECSHRPFLTSIGYLHCLMFKLSGRWHSDNRKEVLGDYYYEKSFREEYSGNKLYFKKVGDSDQRLTIEVRDDSVTICLDLKNKNEERADIYTSNQLLLDDVFTLQQKKIFLNRGFGYMRNYESEFELTLSCSKIDDPTLLNRKREALLLKPK